MSSARLSRKHAGGNTRDSPSHASRTWSWSFERQPSKMSLPLQTSTFHMIQWFHTSFTSYLISGRRLLIFFRSIAHSGGFLGAGRTVCFFCHLFSRQICHKYVHQSSPWPFVIQINLLFPLHCLTIMQLLWMWKWRYSRIQGMQGNMGRNEENLDRPTHCWRRNDTGLVTLVRPVVASQGKGEAVPTRLLSQEGVLLGSIRGMIPYMYTGRQMLFFGSGRTGTYCFLGNSQLHEGNEVY